MGFVREGFWLRRGLDGEVLAVYRADPGFHDFVYNKTMGSWVELSAPNSGFGMSDDYDKITESEALEALGLVEW